MKNRKLNNYSVNDIRAAKLLDNMTDTETAAYYNISRKTVYNILNNKRYTDVPVPTLNSFPSYTIYNDGRIVSNRTKKPLKVTTNKVRIINNAGIRVTVDVKQLITKAFTEM